MRNGGEDPSSSSLRSGDKCGTTRGSPRPFRLFEMGVGMRWARGEFASSKWQMVGGGSGENLFSFRNGRQKCGTRGRTPPLDGRMRRGGPLTPLKRQLAGAGQSLRRVDIVQRGKNTRRRWLCKFCLD